MHSQPLERLAHETASEIWSWLPGTDYDDRSDLIDDILGLIFRVQAESLAADAVHLVAWYHELELTPYARLVCEVEQLAGGPQRFLLYYSDPQDDFIPLREWEDASTGVELRKEPH